MSDDSRLYDVCKNCRHLRKYHLDGKCLFEPTEFEDACLPPMKFYQFSTVDNPADMTAILLWGKK